MPRLGVAYDLFGNGRTAIKATFSKYVFGSEIITYTRLANPSGSDRHERDADVERHQRRLPAAGERARARSARGTSAAPRITQRYDPDINNGWGKRGNNWEISATIEHELHAPAWRPAPPTSTGGGTT